MLFKDISVSIHNLLISFFSAVYYGAIDAVDLGNIDPIKYPPSLGITLELCAGIVDKSISFIEIAREEILEECGYDVPSDRLEEVMTYK